MEVHAHTHSARKKWTHYFWEFLMLFLAVFAGFLAENQREHMVEKARGKQYILSFCEDLKSDTTNFNLLIKELKDKQSELKNLANCFDSLSGSVQSTECLKKIIINSMGFSDFIYSDTTIQQLKYAGGLRLIQDKEIADSIVRYDAMVREEQIHQQVLENQQQITINAHNTMIGFEQLRNLKMSGVSNDIFLLTNDRREMNKYFNELFTFQRGCLGQLTWMKYLKGMATRMLYFLNKKHY